MKKTLTAIALVLGLGIAGAAQADELICRRAISPGDASAAAVMTMAQRIACDGGDAALELQQRFELTELLLRLTPEPEKTALARELTASDAKDEQACGITAATPIPAPQSIVDCVRHKGLFAMGFVVSMLSHGTKAITALGG